MKILKRIYILLLSAVLIIGGSGCSMKNESSETKKPEPTLNEWQKNFLAEQKLPTEYEELNLTQRLSVAAIYEMIMYLEDKYGVTFEYTGYVRPQILENEYMTAIPKGGNELTDTVTVTRQDDGTLTDDYPNIVVRPYYEQMITDYVEDYFGSENVKILSKVTNTTIKDFSDISEAAMDGNVFGTNIVFIKNDICTQNQLSFFVDAFSKWLNEHDLISTNRINVVTNVEISDIDLSNCTDYYDDEYLVYDLMCYIELNGKVIIN